MNEFVVFVAEIRHKKMSFPISQNQQQQHTSASLERRKRRRRTTTTQSVLLFAFLFFLVEILPVVRAFPFLKSFNTDVLNSNSNSSMSDLGKEEKHDDAITIAEDSSVSAEEKEEKHDDAITIAEDSSSFSAEIDATTSLIAKKAQELEQTLKMFERQRMDLHPPSKEETPSYVKLERRPRRVL